MRVRDELLGWFTKLQLILPPEFYVDRVSCNANGYTMKQLTVATLCMKIGTN